MYTYKATVVKIVDGDTVDLNIDLGFHTWVMKRVRLSGINAPERYEEGGKTATEFVKMQIPVGSEVTIQTHLDSNDKYGRVLGEIFTPNNILSINKMLLNNGLATVYDG